MNLGGWLRSLGLERYEAAFREHELDETVLPSLTHETLKELGVTAIGHRLKLLDAIAALHTDGSTKTDSAGAATSSAIPSAAPEDRAERRQVTVMFSDLVGSTALSARTSRNASCNRNSYRARGATRAIDRRCYPPAPHQTDRLTKDPKWCGAGRENA
jgi:SAM domain (Sterile alpha motif)